MQKLKQLSGREVVKIFETYGFVVKRSVGSHVRLVLVRDEFIHHVTIPLHNSLKKGTLHGIAKDFALCFGEDETHRCFFN